MLLPSYTRPTNHPSFSFLSRIVDGVWYLSCGRASTSLLCYTTYSKCSCTIASCVSQDKGLLGESTSTDGEQINTAITTDPPDLPSRVSEPLTPAPSPFHSRRPPSPRPPLRNRRIDRWTSRPRSSTRAT